MPGRCSLNRGKKDLLSPGGERRSFGVWPEPKKAMEVGVQLSLRTVSHSPSFTAGKT